MKSKLGPAMSIGDGLALREVLAPRLRTVDDDPYGCVVDGLLNKNGELESKTALKTAKEIDVTISIYSYGLTEAQKRKPKSDSYLAFWLEVKAEFKRTLKSRRKIEYVSTADL